MGSAMERMALKKGDALVVVDVQNDFLPGGALGVRNGDGPSVRDRECPFYDIGKNFKTVCVVIGQCHKFKRRVVLDVHLEKNLCERLVDGDLGSLDFGVAGCFDIYFGADNINFAVLLQSDGGPTSSQRDVLIAFNQYALLCLEREILLRPHIQIFFNADRAFVFYGNAQIFSG